MKSESRTVGTLVAGACWVVLSGSAGATDGEDRTSTRQLAQASADAASRDSLFGDAAPGDKAPESSRWRGFLQLEAARAYRDPEHWSKGRLRVELTRQGELGDNVKWKIGGRFDYDAAYDRSGFYPHEVRQDQRAEFMLRENYIDFTAGAWDVRLGRQHIVWGEIVGLFVADVVSAKDMREFVLQEFGQMRIPQWAARAEYFSGDFHAEAIWIPVPTVDRIGKPGADFFPHPLPAPASYLGEERPDRRLDKTNYGVRLSQLTGGWDIAGFYYHSVDTTPTFYRVSAPAAPLVFQPRHDEIDQMGGTLSKDLGNMVLRAEAVYTRGRKFNVTRVTEPDGLVRQNTLDYVVGVDVPLAGDTRLNVQFLQRVFFAHDPDIIPDRHENLGTVMLSGTVAPRVEAQALLIHSLNRTDWMFRPRLAWNFERNWRLAVGADILGGERTGVFGRFDSNDRVYTEVRYSF